MASIENMTDDEILAAKMPGDRGYVLPELRDPALQPKKQITEDDLISSMDVQPSYKIGQPDIKTEDEIIQEEMEARRLAESIGRRREEEEPGMMDAASEFVSEFPSRVARGADELYPEGTQAREAFDLAAGAVKGAGQLIGSAQAAKTRALMDPETAVEEAKEFGTKIVEGDPQAQEEALVAASMSMVPGVQDAADVELARRDVKKAMETRELGDIATAGVSTVFAAIPLVGVGLTKSVAKAAKKDADLLEATPISKLQTDIAETQSSVRSGMISDSEGAEIIDDVVRSTNYEPVFVSELDEFVEGMQNKFPVSQIDSILGRKPNPRYDRQYDSYDDMTHQELRDMHNANDSYGSQMSREEVKTLSREALIEAAKANDVGVGEAKGTLSWWNGEGQSGRRGYERYLYTKIPKGEFEARGLDDFIEQAKATGSKSITKDDLKKHLESNQVQIKETRKGGDTDQYRFVKRLRDKQKAQNDEDAFQHALQLADIEAEAVESLNYGVFGTRFLPGLAEQLQMKTTDRLLQELYNGAVSSVLDTQTLRRFLNDDWKDKLASRVLNNPKEYSIYSADKILGEEVVDEILELRRSVLNDPQPDLNKVKRLAEMLSDPRLGDKVARDASKAVKFIEISERARDVVRSFGNAESTQNLKLVQDDLIRMGQDRFKFAPATFEDITAPGGSNYQEILLSVDTNKMRQNPHTPRHYSEVENLMVHIRTKDRVDDEGRKILFVEEIQSDMHQDARKYGYFNPDETFDIIDLDGKVVASVANDSQAEKFIKNHPTFGTDAELDYRDSRLQGGSQYNKVSEHAPFKKTGEWTGLAVKRILREAAEGGYDGVAFPRADVITPVVTNYQKHMGKAEDFIDNLKESGDEMSYRSFKGNLTYYDQMLPNIIKRQLGRNKNALGKKNLKIEDGMEGFVELDFNYVDLTPEVSSKFKNPQKLFEVAIGTAAGTAGVKAMRGEEVSDEET